MQKISLSFTDWESVQSTTRRMSFESHCLSIGSQSQLNTVNPSPASQLSQASLPSEQEMDSVNGRKKKRRKRRKRTRNRVAPVLGTPSSLLFGTSSGCVSTEPASFASSGHRGSIASASAGSTKQSSDQNADNESSDDSIDIDRCRLPPGTQSVKAVIEPRPEGDKDETKTENSEAPLAGHPKKILVSEYVNEQATEEDSKSPSGGAKPKRKNSPVPASVTKPKQWKNPFVHHRHHHAGLNPFSHQYQYGATQPLFQNPWQNPFLASQHAQHWYMPQQPVYYNNPMFVAPPGEISPHSAQSEYWNQHISPLVCGTKTNFMGMV